MYFDFSQKSSLLLVFFIHGLLLCALALQAAYHRQDRALYWLSAFLCLSTLYIAPFMFGYAGWYGRDGYREALFYIPFQQLFLLPPVMYIYIRLLLDPSFRVNGVRLMHFIPAFLYLLYSVWVFVHDMITSPELDFYRDGRDRDFSAWYQVTGFCSMLWYAVASLRHYILYRNNTVQSLSYADSVRYAWIRQVLWALVALLFLRSLFFILNPEWAEFGRKFWYYFCFSNVFCFIGFRGYMHAMEVKAMADVLGAMPMELNPPMPEPAGELLADVQVEPVRSRRDELTDWSVWKQKLEDLMESGEVYRDPLLTLPGLAEQLGIPPRRLSMLINDVYRVNFNDFINRHRTDAVVRKFEAGEHTLQTLLGIAYDCGFNSKSTFNRTFKKHKGVSPKDFLANFQQK